MLVAIQHATYSQDTLTTDTLCFNLLEIKKANAKMERGRAAIKVNKELTVQIHSLDSINGLDSLIRIDFVNSIATYKKDSVTSYKQLIASSNIISIYKKEAAKKNWIIAAICTISAIVKAFMVWAFMP